MDTPYKKPVIGATCTRRPQGVLYPSATAAHDAAIAQRLREQERQFRLGAFERAVLTPPKLSPVLREIHGESVAQAFKDAYSLVFLGLPTGHTEADVEDESFRRFVGDMVFALTQEQRSSGGWAAGGLRCGIAARCHGQLNGRRGVTLRSGGQ